MADSSQRRQGPKSGRNRVKSIPRMSAPSREKTFPCITEALLSSDLPAVPAVAPVLWQAGAGPRQAGQTLKGRLITAQGNALGANRIKSCKP